MESNINLLDLPDLVLHNICTYISDPFDLIHFGNTCTRFRMITSAPSLWWPIAFQWFDGLWIYLSYNSESDHPRDWLIEVFRKVTVLSSGTDTKCAFSDGEEWVRCESRKFRCIFGMLRLVYGGKKNDHPAVLYHQFAYDVGLYVRVNVHTDFSNTSEAGFSEDAVNVLSHLGQAADRDLRRRKQPNKDPKYYIRYCATAKNKWMSELFPTGLYGTICPMLICPFQNSFTDETTGLQGLSVCLSEILALYLKRCCKSLRLKDILSIIKTFCAFFVQEIANMLPEMQSRFSTTSLKALVPIIIKEKLLNVELLQTVLDVYSVNFTCRDVLTGFVNKLRDYDGIDSIVERVRLRLRYALYDEINSVLFQNDNNDHTVTRINLTDSDLIGGDNARQEMSASAFISKNGVLITWHLTGRMRF